MTERIIIAGAGGQGIMLLGKVLALAAMKADKYVTWLPSYGAEVRGGTAHCLLVISDKPIGSPCFDKSDSLIIMNGPSLEKFKSRIKNKGLLIINSSLAHSGGDKNVRILQHPFTDIAIRLGNIKVANMVALGCYLSQSKLIKPQDVIEAMQELAPEGKKDLIEINQQALMSGVKLKDDKS